jgi:hypothetical protein
MTNDPRDPLGGQQPGMPGESSGSDSEQAATSGQTPGQGQAAGSGQGQAAGASASEVRPTPAGSASEERSYEAQPERGRMTTATHTYEVPEGSDQGRPTRTYEAPPKSRNTKMMALFGILGILALGGIIAGLVASNTSRPTVPPAAAARGHLVASVSGTGVRYSAPFKVTHSPVTARYSYRCTTGNHGFIAALAQSRTNITTITSTRGRGIARTVSVAPTSVGSFYRLAASSTCPYHVSVFER